LLPNQDVDREFLAWILRRPETVDWVMRAPKGSRMPRADIDHLLSLVVPKPPLDKQKRIVGKLKAFQARTDRLETDLEKRVVQLLMLGQRIIAEALACNDEPLPLSSVVASTRNGLYKHESFYGRGTPILKMYNVGRFDGELDLTRLDRVELTAD